MITESMSITDDCRLQAIFYGALHEDSGECRCTCSWLVQPFWRSLRFRYQWIRHNAIDVYDWWLRLMPAAEAPVDAESWAKALPPWWFQQWPTPRYTGYGYGWSVVYELGSQDMETGSLVDVSCFSLLLFSSLDLGPVQIALAWVFTTFGVSQVEVDFPCGPDPPKGHPAWYQSVVGLMSSYEYIRGIIVSVFPLLSFPTLVQGYAAQEVCT